ncbi:hypothetical protein [Steroidobacter sp.]|uniref:hypothetical protein n=1 Tax=Steroidobacter sp. TaxID=1978227 RepID=UPI001A5AA743|nr:hypothetical protein [Steroidobacter sp.]MBL8268909.1 hypothetical protein [Steroidobacter sp.]
MHARIEHLLSLRDAEPVPAEVAEHVRACPICTGELQRLSTIRGELQALPQFEPPALAWDRIRQTVPEHNRGLRPHRVGLAAAAAAAITLTVIALVTGYADRRNADAAAELAQVVPQVEDAIPHVNELVAQSQELEQLLRKLPDRPRIERVSTAATIDTIEQRIQWLDFQLSSAPEGDLSEAQSRQLWRERVELMDSLVKVRYAEAGALWF